MTPKPWRSGFCTAPDHADWQHAACHGGHSRTPTKADPRDWVPCACPRHIIDELEPAMSETVGTIGITPPPDYDPPIMAFDKTKPPEGEHPPAPVTLPIAVEVVQTSADRLSTAAAGAIESLDWEDAVRLLDTLRAAAHTIGQVDSLLVRQAYLRGPHGKNAAELDGIGLVSIGRSADRKHWDERGVARAVIDAKMADTTGEAPDPWEVAEWLLETFGVGYCRVTPLRALGLEPEAFCDTMPGKPTVSLPPRT